MANSSSSGRNRGGYDGCGTSKIVAFGLCFAVFAARALAEDGPGSTPPLAAGVKKFSDLIKPLDIYAPPPGVSKLLTLDEIYEIIASRGLPIKKAREDRATAEQAYKAYRRTFLPQLTLSTSHGYSDSVQGTGVAPDESFDHSKNRAHGASLGASGALPYGIGYGVQLAEINRTDTFGGGGSGGGPSYAAGLGYNLSLQLAKDSIFFLKDSATTQANWNRRLADLTLKSQVMQALMQGQQTFFDLLLRELRLRIQRNGVEASRAFRREVGEKQRLGEVDDFSVIAADLQLAQAEQDLATTESDFESAKEDLAEQLDMNSEELKKLYPDTSIFKEFPPLPKMEVAEMVKKARVKRPDYLQARLGAQQASLGLELERQRRLPSVALSYARKMSDSADTVGKAYSEAASMRQRTDTYGLTMNYVLWNDPQDQTFRNAITTKEKARLSLEELDNRLMKELRKLKSKVETGYQRLEMSGRSRDLAERKLRAEYTKFQVGEGSIKGIVDAQKEVDNARLSELSTKIEVLGLLAQFRNSLGELPEGIEVRGANG